MFAREVAKQGAVADFHPTAVEDTERAAVLVSIKGSLAILETAVVELGNPCFFQTDAVPAATAHVEEMETRRVGNGEGNGVCFRADGSQQGIVFDKYLVKALEKHRCSGQNAQ